MSLFQVIRLPKVKILTFCNKKIDVSTVLQLCRNLMGDLRRGWRLLQTPNVRVTRARKTRSRGCDRVQPQLRRSQIISCRRRKIVLINVVDLLLLLAFRQFWLNCKELERSLAVDTVIYSRFCASIECSLVEGDMEPDLPNNQTCMESWLARAA